MFSFWYYFIISTLLPLTPRLGNDDSNYFWTESKFINTKYVMIIFLKNNCYCYYSNLFSFGILFYILIIFNGGFKIFS